MLVVAIALGLAIVAASLGDILLSRGMQAVGEIRVRHIRDIPRLLKIVFTTPLILLGVLSMAVYFGSYMAALTAVDVSVANPLTALSYLIATAYAAVMLKERISPIRAAGIVLIVLGSIFVGISS